MEMDDFKKELVTFIRDGNDINKLIADVKKTIENEDKFTISFGNDIKPPHDGWTLISDNGKMPQGKITFELVSFLKDNEFNISGDKMIERAQEMGCDYNQQTAKIILKNQDKIPEAWRKFYIVFAGTVWRDSDGRRSVPYLDWDGEQWVLYFGWLKGGWYAYARFPCPCK